MKMDECAHVSRMNRWNPGFKMLVGFLTLVLCVCSHGIWVGLVVFLTMSLLTVLVGKIGIRHYLRYLEVPLAFLIIGALTIAVEFAKTPNGDWNLKLFGIYLVITKGNLFRAVSVSFKALGAVCCLYMISLSTGLEEIVLVLQKIHVPSLIIELMHLIYRYIFVMYDIYEKMHHAALSRMGYRDYRTSLRTFAQILGNLFVVSLQKANIYYDAMLSRGYDGTLAFWQDEKVLDRRLLFPAAVYLLAVTLLMIGTFR